jgi:hypothetical protein
MQRNRQYRINKRLLEEKNIDYDVVGKLLELFRIPSYKACLVSRHVQTLAKNSVAIGVWQAFRWSAVLLTISPRQIHKCPSPIWPPWQRLTNIFPYHKYSCLLWRCNLDPTRLPVRPSCLVYQLFVERDRSNYFLNGSDKFVRSTD